VTLGALRHWAANNATPGHAVPKIGKRCPAQDIGLQMGQIVDSGKIGCRTGRGAAIREEHGGVPLKWCGLKFIDVSTHWK
jgi:hypothetical protein